MISKKVSFENLYPIIESTIKRGNEFSFCAFGRSMLPFIRDGKDLVTLGPVTDSLRVHNIVFYRRDNRQFVLHRIIRVRVDGTYDMCGDNQFSIEKGIRPDQIIAVLVRLERKGKNFPLNSLSVRIWCFFLPLRRFFLHIIRALKHRLFKCNH